MRSLQSAINGRQKIPAATARRCHCTKVYKKVCKCTPPRHRTCIPDVVAIGQELDGKISRWPSPRDQNSSKHQQLFSTSSIQMAARRVCCCWSL